MFMIKIVVIAMKISFKRKIVSYNVEKMERASGLLQKKKKYQDIIFFNARNYLSPLPIKCLNHTQACLDSNYNGKDELQALSKIDDILIILKCVHQLLPLPTHAYVECKHNGFELQWSSLWRSLYDYYGAFF